MMETHKTLVGVHLLDLPYSLDTEYTYYVPDTFISEIAVGSFVLVPFGGANKKHTAIVTSFVNGCDYKKIKPILSSVSEKLALTKDMLDMVYFLRERAVCTVGEAVMRLIPPHAFDKAEEYYYAVDKKAVFDLSDTESAVYHAIAKRKNASTHVLQKEFPELPLRKILKSLKEKNCIADDFLIKETKGKTEKIYYENPGGDALVLSKPRTPQMQRKLYADIKENGMLKLSEITAMGYTASHANALVKKGLLLCKEEEIIRNPYENVVGEKKELQFNKEQQTAYDTLASMMDDGKPHASLLFGVTGSGKTGVILALCEKALQEKKTVLVLIPEIALTLQSVLAFTARFGDKIAVMHSGLSDGERFDAYMRIRKGELPIVLGTRSAIFAPLENIGLIVMDEEHDAAYKSDMPPKYHARDIAKWRAVQSKALLVMASATPSVESYYEAAHGKYELVTMKHRWSGAALPKVQIADMKGSDPDTIIGKDLQKALCDVFENGKQSMLFLNRRGMNSVLTCHSCGEPVLCPHCSVALTHHKGRGGHRMVCHYCGYQMPVPRFCPSCAGEHMSFGGYGTELLEDEVQKILPDSKLLRMDADTTKGKFARDEITGAFAKGDADILVGTQMIAKGHNFKNLQLVGVVAADNSLFVDDFRANERTFSLITQVIGRAGRFDGNGVAIIQTYNPDNATIKLAAKQDYESFYQNEIAVRKALTFPPFCDIAVFSFASEEEDNLHSFAEDFTKALHVAGEKDKNNIRFQIFGPMEAPIYKIQNKYRMRTVLKFKNNKFARAVFASLLAEYGKKAAGKITLAVDINPTGT